ncbi:hypothetical protein [Candidatus Poriferisodalis sp.]|uniref:hypothetical protein n=1 Tax=Candidatus Poriferisodalis sp. TaxID=3101277 RepID=UPI003AF40FF4
MGRWRRVGVAVAAAGALVGVLALWAPLASANVTGISVSVSSGGSCWDVSTPSGFDDAFSCSLVEGGSLVVVGSATSNRNSLRLWWSSTGGVSDRESQGALQVDVLPDFSTRYWRENTATLTCTSDGTATLTARDSSDTDRVKLTVDCVPPPEVSISGWGGERRQLLRPGTVTLSDGFDVSPSDAVCTSDQVNSGTPATVGPPVGSGSRRTVSVTVIDSDPAVVEVECSRTGYVTASERATFVALAPSVSITAVSGDTRDGPGAMTGSFTVSPSWARCSAEHWSGITAEVDPSTGTTASRTVSVNTIVDGTPRTGALRARVSCDATGYETATATALFSARRIAVEVVGFVDASGDADNDAVESFLARPDTASCTAARVSGDPDADVAIADTSNPDEDLEGHWTVTVGSDVVGAVGVEVRCTAPAYYAGTDTESFVFAALREVSISGWGGERRQLLRPGTVTLSDGFDVSPSDAVCTSDQVNSGTPATVGPPVGSGSRRTVSVTVIDSDPAVVEVECSRTGYVTASERATFVALAPSVSITAVSGDTRDGPGAMTGSFTVSPSWARCSAEHWSGITAEVDPSTGTTASRTVSVNTIVDGTPRTGALRARVSCDATGYETATATALFSARRIAVEVVGFVDASGDADNDAVESFLARPDTASCTAARVSGDPDADVAIADTSNPDEDLEGHWTVTVGSDVVGAVGVEVRCTAPAYYAGTDTESFVFAALREVSISGWGGERRQLLRPGTVTLSDGFDVWPSDAVCTSDQVNSGTPATVGPPVGSGSRRTVSVTVIDSDAAVVEVECSRTGYVTASERATFVALAPSVSITAVSGDTRDGPGAMTGSFTVSPSWARCSAEHWSGITAEVDPSTGTSASRTVSVDTVVDGTPRTGALRARVSCDATGYETATATALFSARRIAVEVVGFVDASGDADNDAVESFLARPDTASCTAARVSGDPDADVAIADTSNRDEGLVGHWTVRVGSDVVGAVGVEVRCTVPAYYAGTDTESFVFAALPAVSISDPVGGSRDGPGTMTGSFTVAPETAVCTSGHASGIAAAVGAPAGADTATRTVGVDTVVGGTPRTGEVSVRVSCSLAEDPSVTDTRVLSFEARRVAVSIVGLRGEVTADAAPPAGEGFTVAPAAEGFLVMPVGAHCTPTVVSGDENAVAVITEDSDEAALRLLSVTSGVAGTVGVQVRCTAAAYHDGTDTVDVVFAALAVVVISGFEGAVGSAADLSGGFGVSPASASCRRVFEGIDATVTFTDDDGADRVVRVAVTGSATGKVTVTVTCTATRHVSASATAEFVRTGDCSTDLGLLEAGTVTRSGTLSATDGCRSWVRGSESSPNHARRYTLRVPAASRITVDASSSAVDLYLYALRGSGAAAQVLGSDNNSGSANTGDARLAEVPVAAGVVYVIEVTTSTARDTGAFTLTVLTAADLPLVHITGLGSRIEPGFGTVTVDEGFTVDPPTAVCSSSPLGVVTEGAEAADRTLSADLRVGTTTAETVTCSADGHADGTQNVQLSARSAAAVSNVSVTATARGSCTPTTAAGFDKAYACTMTRGDSLEVSAAADANTGGARIGWAAAGGVSVVGGVSRPAALVSSPDGAVSYWQSARTATVGCTATGTATVTVTLADAADYTAQVTVACEAPTAVLISGLDDTDHSGDASAPVSDSFEVTPGTAECTASSTAGTATVTGTGNRRTVSAAVASGATATVTVSCSQAPLAADSESALFSGEPVDVCNDPLGTLGEGITSASGVIAADAACISTRRHRIALGWAYYTRRHTFSLAGPATVTIDLGDDRSDTATLDTFLVLIGGDDAAAGTRIGADDDGGARGTDSRLSDVDLARGVYTIEATTYAIRATGAYTLAVDVAYDSEVVIDGPESSTLVGDVDVSGAFTVTPAAAACTAASTVGTATITPDTGATRTVTLPMVAPASAVVTVTCVADDHADGIARATFAVTEPAEVASVTLTSGGACTAAGDPAEGVDQAFGCAVALGGTAALNITAAASHAAISLAWATTGDDVTAALGTVPDATLGLDGLWHTTGTATLGCTAAGTHTATLTVTAGTGTDVDTHLTRLTVTCGSAVRIDGLEDTTGSGSATVTVSDEFTVAPGAAACTAAPVGTVTAGPEGVVGARVLSAEFAVPAATAITVTCTGVGYADGVADVVFAHAGAVTSVSVTATSGGTCAAAAAPSGVDAALDCDMAADAPLVLSVAADASAFGPSLGWATSGGVSRVRSTQSQRASPLVVLGASLGSWRRTGTVTLSCTQNGTATLTVSLPAAASHLTQVSADCQDRVQITGLSDTTHTGAGTVTVTDGFSVEPAGASCTATATAGTPTVTAGTGGARTASVGVAAGSSADVTVTCTHAGRAEGTATVAFAARTADSCAEHMGTLGVGTTTRSGTVAAVSGCTSPQRRRDGGTSGSYYARRHGFTVSSPLRVQIDLASAATNTSRLDTYLLLLEGHSPDGTGAVLGRNDDVGSGHGTHRYNSRLAGVELAPGDYTIEATTYGSRRTGDYTLTVVAAGGAGAACTDHLGTLPAGRYTAAGTVAAVQGCTSTHRGSQTSRPNARWHTFTLDAPAWIDIDLAASPASTLDPYVLLLSGHANTGAVLHQDDNSGIATAAQIHDKYLEAGAYTIETTAATHTGVAGTGDYTLTVTVPVSGLAQSVDATVDEQTTVNFNYWPVTRSVSFGSQRLSTDILYDYFGFGHSAARGYGSVTLWPDRSAPHELALSLGAVSSGSSSGATQGRSSTRSPTARQTRTVDSPREFLFRVFSRCGPGEKLSPNNRILCVDASANVEVRTPGKETPVTVGTLLAIDHVSKEAVRLHARPCSNGLTVKPRQIAALLIAIGIYELDMSRVTPLGEFVYRYPARSAMGLSRQDFGYAFYYSRDAAGVFGPMRAYWHVGAGMFQLDDRFRDSQVNAMTHAERADIHIGGKLAAEDIVEHICDADSHGSFEDRAKVAMRPWLGCRRNLVEKCVDQTYPKLYIARGDDLYVTTYLAAVDPDLPANPRVPAFPLDYTGDYSPQGGIKKMMCRWDTNPSNEFDCYFYDTDNPEGWFDRGTPDGASVRRASPNPLAAPFFSVTGRVRRAVVFPASFLGSSDSWIRSVPFGRKIHETAEANAEVPSPDPRLRIDWTRNSHDFGDGVQRILEVWTRERSPSDGGPLCGWVSVNDNSSAANGQNLARCVRYMYPNQG